MRRLLVAVLACASVAHAQDEEEPEVTDLEALVALAEERYPSLQADAHAMEAAEAQLGEARLSPFFQWQATAGLTIAPEARGTPIFSEDDQLPLENRWRPAAQVDVRGVVPLFTFGKLRNAWRAARAGVSAARAQRERSRARLRFDVRRAYFGMQLALDTEQMIREGRGYLTRARQTLEEKLEDDDADVDPLDARRLATAIAELDARASENVRLLRSTEAAMRVLTGLEEVRIPDCPMASAELEERSVGEYLAQLERPEMGMLEAAQEAREAELDIQRARFAPDLGLGFNAGISWAPGITDQTNPFIQDSANTPRLGAGLFMRWNLDFAGQWHRTERTRAQLEQLRAQTDEARRGIRLEVTLAYEKVQDADRREQAWGRGEREGRAWLVEAAQAYDLGTGAPRDLIDALRAYFTHRFSHLQAIFDLNVAMAELERTVGAPVVERWEPPCD